MTKIEYKNYIFSDEPGASNQVKPGGQLNLSMSLISDVLEINTFDFVVESEDRSLVRFTKNDLITVYQDDIKIGIFYVQSVERVAANLYSFYAVSAIGLLDQMKHYGGIYTGQTMQEIVSDICGNIPFYIKHNLKNIKLYGWLPIATSRENLSQVLMATGACIKTDMDGIVRIEGLWDGIANIIGKDSLYLGGNVTYDSEVTQVVVVEHQYIEGQEETTLFEGTTQSGDLITFSEPMYDLTADGISILNSNANYAKVSAGAGTLKGKKYIHTTRQIVRPVSAESREVSAADDDQSSVRTVDSATLISLVNSSAVANRLANFYKWVETINTSVAYKREQPGNVVSVYHPYDNEQVNACLQSASVTISSVLAADETLLVGYVPPQIEDVLYYDEMLIVDKDSEIKIPEGTTSMHAVLIGGGQGGQAGEDGNNGEDGTSASISAGSSGTKEGKAGNGGEGGSGGTGGNGGKIFSVDLEDIESKTILVKIGLGGAGGDKSGEYGSLGSETEITIGSEKYSSAQGASSPNGYVDTVTGETYAINGNNGKPGGKGGGGGSRSGNSAEAGESLYGQSGGNYSDNYVDSGTEKSGEMLDPEVSQSWGSPSSYISNGTTIVGQRISGYGSYSVSESGYISHPTTLKTIGYTGGTDGSNVTFATGTVYQNVKNPSPPTNHSGIINSSIDSVEVEDVSNSYKRMKVTTTTLTVKRKYVYETYTLNWTIASNSSGGGGSAYGASGNNATISGERTLGGNGADATKPSTPQKYGAGGNGGHGGAGGGGGGAGYVSVTSDSNKISKYVRGLGGMGGQGGLASSGSTGANGCLILYFGIAKKKGSGLLIDRNERGFVDKYGRYFVV